jgi:hypothetical protein
MKPILFIALAMLIFCLPARAQEAEGKGAAMQIKASATVTAIDQKTRTVTLKTADGKEFTGEVSPDVKNLKQVKVGDVVNVTYTAALAFRLNPTNGAPSQAAAAATTAKPGEKPAAAAGRTVTINAKVQAVDTSANTVTFKGPKGNVRTVEVKDPQYQEKLKKLKVGDVVEITYAEALVITVDEATKK